jgi:hypothetical protein
MAHSNDVIGLLKVTENLSDFCDFHFFNQFYRMYLMMCPFHKTLCTDSNNNNNRSTVSKRFAINNWTFSAFVK